MTAPEIVAIGEDDLAELHQVLSLAFGSESSPERVDDERLVVELDRMIGVSDQGRLVGSAGAYSFRLTVPGLDTVATAGVTWVGVAPTHRRRGILRQMMDHQLDDVAERGEPVAVLTASEATIYGRFGYGVGARHERASVRADRSAFVTEPHDEGSIRLTPVADKDAIATAAGIYDCWRGTRPGALSLHEGWWERIRRDRAHARPGRGSSLVAIHHDHQGGADGYATYSVKHDMPDNVVHVHQVVAIDAAAEAALWRFLLDLDLTKRVVAMSLPVDDPLKWRLRDPRAMTAEYVEDWLWARILDVPAALEARAYDTEGVLHLEVVDPFRPGGRASGTFRLDASPDGARCDRVDGAAADVDVTITVEALGSAWLGAAAPSTLAAAGRATGAPDALALADALFQTRPAPFSNNPF